MPNLRTELEALLDSLYRYDDDVLRENLNSEETRGRDKVIAAVRDLLKRHQAPPEPETCGMFKGWSIYARADIACGRPATHVHDNGHGCCAECYGGLNTNERSRFRARRA
jgi:hypothetical protein